MLMFWWCVGETGRQILVLGRLLPSGALDADLMTQPSLSRSNVHSKLLPEMELTDLPKPESSPVIQSSLTNLPIIM
jgi:hypothetical protein